MDCLTKIVGLSGTGCDCWDNTKPTSFEDLNESTSGLYISQADTVPLRIVGSSADCENGGIWDLVIQSRDGVDGRGGAVRDFVKDFLMASQATKHNQFLPFDHIGDDYYKTAKAVKGSVAGFYFEPYRIKGGKIKIQSIDLAFFNGIAGSLDVDISVYSSLDLTTPLSVSTATVTGNKQFFKATLATELVIDLGKIRDDLNERIYFLYTVPVGANPASNESQIKVCCNGSKFERNPYLQLMCNIGGIQADTVPEVETKIKDSSSTMNGLFVNASFECDYYSWLCNLAQKPNQPFATDTGENVALGMALADGLRAKCVVNLINSILNSSRINHYTMLQDPKKMYEIRGRYMKIYVAAIDNIVYYMPSTVTDCLVCTKSNQMIKVTI